MLLLGEMAGRDGGCQVAQGGERRQILAQDADRALAPVFVGQQGGLKLVVDFQVRRHFFGLGSPFASLRLCVRLYFCPKLLFSRGRWLVLRVATPQPLQLALDALDAVADRLLAGVRAGQERLQESDAEEIVVGRVAPQRVKAGGGQPGKKELLDRTRGQSDQLCPALAKVARHLALDILFEAACEQSGDLFRGVARHVGDGRRLQHVHQVGEALGPAIVGRGRGEDQAVAGARQQAGQPVALAAGVGHVVALVDDDHVPVALFEVVTILGVVLQCVDGDDRAVVVGERILVGGDPGAHPLQADRIEAHQGNRKAHPDLLLKLGQHGADGHHQNALPAAALDQLAEQDAHFDGLAEPDAVGDQDARAQGLQRPMGGRHLVRGVVDRALVAQVNVVVGRRRAPEQAFQI